MTLKDRFNSELDISKLGTLSLIRNKRGQDNIIKQRNAEYNYAELQRSSV